MKNGNTNGHTIKIERGIPLPSGKRGPKPKYPFAQMRRGDSFTVAGHNQRNSACNSARIQGVKVRTARDGDGYRIWRVA